MIINKSESFLTDDEIKDLRQINKLRTLTNQLRTDEAEKEKKGIYDEVSERLDILNYYATERYSQSFNGDKTAILTDAKETLSYITKEDFLDYQQANPHRKIKKSFDGFCQFLWSILIPQVNALVYNGFSSTELQPLIEEKATQFYRSPRRKRKSEVLPNDNFANLNYLKVKQGKVTNQFPTSVKNAKSNYKGLTITSGTDYKCMIPNSSNLKKLTAQTKQVLYWLMMIAAYNNLTSDTDEFEFDIDSYFSEKGVQNTQKAREQLASDMTLLTQMTLQYTITTGRGKKRKEKHIGDFNIIGGWNWTNQNKKDRICFNFTKDMMKQLKSYEFTTVMNIPRIFWRLNTHYNPSSCDLLIKIATHKNMNYNKSNADIIAVQTLLDSTQHIPTIEEVSGLNRNTAERIIKPFERDMNALHEAFDWCYCKPRSNGQELTPEELQNIDFNVFKELLIKIKWKDYPDQTARLEHENQKSKAIEPPKNKPK